MLMRRDQNWLPDVFNDFFDVLPTMPKMNATAPAINVIEKANEYDVEIAAPGMTREDFKVTLDQDDNLIVDLEKKVENKNEKTEGHYLRREFAYTKFHQHLLLPDDVDREAISASVEHGVLTVTLPKVKPQETKRETKVIDIK